jgi:HEPN domain-containing protein
MPNRALDWLRQADRDFEQAMDSRHEWACFAAQQAAEKAIKALHLHTGQEAWGHVIAQLLEELPETIDVPELLVEKGSVLDNFYVPSRYPNGHSTGAPFEHYSQLQSEVAIRHAREIIEFARAQMARCTNR